MVPTDITGTGMDVRIIDTRGNRKDPGYAFHEAKVPAEIGGLSF